jgi:lactoylglutathione lyase
MLVRHVAVVPERLTSQHDEKVARDIARVTAALQTQVTRDLRPLWHVDATVTAFTSIEDVPLGHWVVFLKESIGEDDELGFHLDSHNQPYALVAYDKGWTLSLSHEILEILVDPSGNRLVAGPSVDPKHSHHRVRYLLELCDPCEDSAYSYTIDGVVVSDFITPHYHDPQDTTGARYSFTGALRGPRDVLPGGYLTWERPRARRVVPAQRRAEARHQEAVRDREQTVAARARQHDDAAARRGVPPQQREDQERGTAPDGRCGGVGRAGARVALAGAIGYRTRMPRYLHTSIFVSDMAASIDFYTNKMGLKLLGGPHHYPGNADMAFVGSSWDAYIELVYDLEDHPPYELGNRYEHLALEVDGDLPGVIEKLRAQGVKIVKEPKKSPGGNRAIAFVEDPNGIPVELLEPREGPVT